MKTVFETFYTLAVDMLHIPELAHLTAHHRKTRAEAEAIVQAAVLLPCMPGESPGAGTPWSYVRVFARNYVNRAQPFVASTVMYDLLNAVELETEDLAARVELLITQLKGVVGSRADAFAATIRKLTSATQYEEFGAKSYLQWIEERWVYYQNYWDYGREQRELDVDELLRDIDYLSSHKNTGLSGIGLPLAANYFADLGLSVFAKSDVHTVPIISLLSLSVETKDRTRACFKDLIRIAQHERNELMHNRNFHWIHGGLYPRNLDRIIYLIGSDKFQPEHSEKQKKVMAPQRRLLMRNALIREGLLTSEYIERLES